MVNFILHPFASISHGIGRITASVMARFRAHYRLLLYLAGIGAVLFLAPVMGILIASINPLFVFAVLALPLAMLCVHFILPRHELGPIFILFGAAFIPLEIPTGTASVIVDSLLLTVSFTANWILVMIIVEKRFSLKPSPANLPLLAFIVMIIVSLVWSTLFMDPLVDPSNLSGKFVFVQSAAALTNIMLPVAFLLVANHIKEIIWFKILIGIMMLAGVIATLQRFQLMPFNIANDEGLFSMWIVAISAGLALFTDTMPKMLRMLFLWLAALWIYIRFFLGVTWLAGWLPSFMVLAILLFRRSKALFVAAVLVAGIFFALNRDYMDKIFEDETDESGNTRWAAMQVNWRVTGKHIIFGTGPAGYAAYYMSYFPTEGMATHNNVIDIVAQHGIFGLGFCVWFFIALAWQGYKLCLRLEGRGDFVEALANIAFAGTVVCLIMMYFGDWLFPFVYTQTIAGFDYIVYSWLFMGAIVALDHMTKDEVKPADEPQPEQSNMLLDTGGTL